MCKIAKNNGISIIREAAAFLLFENGSNSSQIITIYVVKEYYAYGFVFLLLFAFIFRFNFGSDYIPSFKIQKNQSVRIRKDEHTENICI